MVRQFGGGELPPMRITSFVDAPAGSGLGSSSALVVALVEAFRTFLQAAARARTTWRIPRSRSSGSSWRSPAASRTSTRRRSAAPISSSSWRGDRVIVNPLRVPAGLLNELETSIVICFTGVSRRSEAIIEEQQRRMAAPGGRTLDGLHQLKADAMEMKEALLRGEIAQMADLLNRSWLAKKRTASGISTEQIERMCELARAAGATGGKVSGAGGGGFMMFIVPPPRRMPVIRALNEAGGTASGVHFTNEGAESWSPT